LNDELRSILLGMAGLWAAAVVALYLTLARPAIDVSGMRLRAAVRLAIIAVLAQAAHFAEELATGFHQRFPELLGLTPWPVGFFVSFNLFWLVIWGLSIRGLTERCWCALFPLWFLAIASVANGLAHPLLSLRDDGYFPGLVSSPFVGIAGILLLRCLFQLTDRREGGDLGDLKRRGSGRSSRPSGPTRVHGKMAPATRVCDDSLH
jgi:hypothetical protein